MQQEQGTVGTVSPWVLRSDKGLEGPPHPVLALPPSL
jgi:hypothetical protein